MDNTIILLYNNKTFDFSKLDTEILDIENIAHGLSLICRYAGQGRFHYSVGEHSILVSYFVPEKFALEGLMHDASESVLGDIPKPLKIMMPQYNEMEQALEINLAKQYKLRFPYPREVKYVDIRMRATEQPQLFKEHKFKHLFEDFEPIEYVTIGKTKPREIEKLFLERFEQLKR